MPKKNLKAHLEDVYSKYHQSHFLELDPLGVLDHSLDPVDFEIVAFIAAGLSYGRVEQIRKSLQDLLIKLEPLGLGQGGRGIHDYLIGGFNRKALLSALKGWKHRLNTPEDISLVFERLSQIFQSQPNLCALYQSCHKEDPSEQLIEFCIRLAGETRQKKRSATKKWKGAGARWFFSSPKDGSCCKRICMWLRWMIRQDDIDPGPWQILSKHNAPLPAVSSSRLFIPLDTHLYSWARKLSLTQRKTLNWKTVVEVSDQLRQISPADPLRYDFALCHAGIVGYREKLSNARD